MTYKMKVRITDPNTPKGMTSELCFKLICSFIYDSEQYGNGFFLNIEGEGFEDKFFDLRYDRSFKKSEKEKWLENWAESYWSGKNGAWGIKSLEIEKEERVFNDEQ